jgi:hypothetical protein
MEMWPGPAELMAARSNNTAGANNEVTHPLPLEGTTKEDVM